MEIDRGLERRGEHLWEVARLRRDLQVPPQALLLDQQVEAKFEDLLEEGVVREREQRESG